MKLLISLILVVLSQSVNATRLKIYYEYGREADANKVIEIFKSKYSIPSLLISKQERGRCIPEDNFSLELCITKKGELKMLSSRKLNLLKKSFTVFRQLWGHLWKQIIFYLYGLQILVLNHLLQSHFFFLNQLF